MSGDVRNGKNVRFAQSPNHHTDANTMPTQSCKYWKIRDYMINLAQLDASWCVTITATANWVRR